VTDLLRQHKRDGAFELFKQQGANSEDVSRLVGAASIASDKGISIEEALAYVAGIPGPERVAQSASNSSPEVVGCARIVYALLGGLFFLIALFVLVSGPSGKIIPIAVLGALGAFFLTCCLRAGRHPVIATGLLSGVCFLAALLLFGVLSVLNKACPPRSTYDLLCGGQWSIGAILAIVVLAAFGTFFLFCCVRIGRHRQ
jgi:hypothetical protein